MRSRHLRNSSLVALLVAAAPLVAQGVSTQLGGRVLDAKGQAVPGATVVIRNTETGLTRTLQTSEEGRYMATLLPVGPYQVTVTKAGFQTAANIKVNLNLGDAAPLTVRLAVETGAVVEVMATAPQVDAERASAAAIVSPDNLTNLPVFNRNFTNLATLTPQVVVDSSRGNLAIAGQRGVNTSINIDGGDNNEPFFGGAIGAAEGKTPFTISIEAIREYQVITDGASAEFGRMGGGYVNAITKNGTNELSGSVFYYTRPRIWVESGPTLLQPSGSTTANPVGNFQQEQFGFSVGGPLVKDKLFYFVAYDAQRRKDPINQVWGPANAPSVLNPANAADAVLLAKGGNYSSKADSDTLFARFDWNITTDQALQFRINHSKFKGDVGAGAQAAYENLSSDEITTDTYVLQWNWVINGNWMNEARLSYAKDDMPRNPYASLPEVVIGSGSNTVGYYGAYPFDRTYNTKRTQIQENISYVTPTIQVKGGIDYNSVDVAEFFAGNWRGVYNFTSLANFRAGNWSYYRQNFGLSGPVQSAGQFSATEKQLAAFIQADLRVSDTLKVGLGVRWDKQENPNYPILDMSNRLATSMPLTAKIPTDSQISPRASFTWTPAIDQGKTVLRGSLGRYVSTTPAVFLYQVFAANGRRTGSKDFQPSEAATYGIPIGAAFNPANPFWFSSTPSAFTPFNIWTFSPSFKNPYTDRANVGIERSFKDLVLGFSATYAKSNQLERTEDLNLGTPTANASGRLIYPSTVSASGAYTPVRPNPNYGTMGYYLSDATGIYHAYTASLKYHKEGSAFDAQLYYTYAINKDSDSNERNYSGISIQDQGKLGSQWGYADTDRREVLTGYFSYLDKDITGILTSLSVRYQTGTPYTLTYSADVNGDGNSSNDRYFDNGRDTGRNTQRAGSVLSFDLGLRREFLLTRRVKMTLSTDVFNLLNRQDTYLSTGVSYPTGVTPATVDANYAKNLTLKQNWLGSARQIQVGARFAF
ncbi:carboxypeptidase regulatory-like domain-containing protein [Geothrix sp. PMB-07]|uniref:TonB-dependent receptor n=1 Tax=Geothrix sp. PMB-07 TaxID=3068640 RepID=UPI0027415423|nr:carboxypeptidase regulatory-like domain-containing protein [Geothrix sp. PMB-07]WLT30031.1 carboxypeptidase regulatory-like domain-containing protein [Geothrix sp. PMB-07]